MTTELIMIGGFLGSGKTTSILNMGKYYQSIGKKVAILTNDQGSELVDTQFLKLSGFNVSEATGGCFCCNYENFMNQLNMLVKSYSPDIILAEPVGSCTDLIGTLFQPIHKNLTNKFKLAPLSVLIDPIRFQQMCLSEKADLQIKYLYEKQLEEADIIILNKTDLLTPKQEKELILHLETKYPMSKILAHSNIDTSNIEPWLQLLKQPSYFKTLDITYDIYGEAEQKLGWLNSSLTLCSHDQFSANELIQQLFQCLVNEIKRAEGDIVHLKLIGISDFGWIKYQQVTCSEPPTLSSQGNLLQNKIHVYINARIPLEPQVLSRCFRKSLKQLQTNLNLEIAITTDTLSCFAPGLPNPNARQLNSNYSD